MLPDRCHRFGVLGSLTSTSTMCTGKVASQRLPHGRYILVFRPARIRVRRHLWHRYEDQHLRLSSEPKKYRHLSTRDLDPPTMAQMRVVQAPESAHRKSAWRLAFPFSYSRLY